MRLATQASPTRQRTLTVRTRDGRTCAFRPSAVATAIDAATRHAGCALRPARLDALVNAVCDRLDALVATDPSRPVTTAQIDAAVLAVLDPHHAAAYREAAKRRRRAVTEAADVAAALERVNRRDAKVMAENGNKDARTFVVQRELLAGAVHKAEGLAMLPADVRRAHVEGLIHVHDLDRSPFAAMPNCSLPDFEYLLSHGFSLGNAVITPPQSIGVAATVLVQLLGAISGEQYGGISVHELDRLLEPFAEKSLEKNRALYAEVIDDAERIDELAQTKTAKDIYDAMQAFEYQVNTLTTSAAQTPFTSISMGLGTSWCAREIQKAILAVREQGMSGHTAIFPKILYIVDEGINLAEGDPNYDIKKRAMACSMRRIYPDLLSAPRIRELKDGQMITPMGCRSFLHPWRNSRGEYELVGRNNLGVVSVNLPRIATAARGSVEDFFAGLDDAVAVALRGLKLREEVVLSADLDNAPLMYTQGGMGDPTGKTCVRDYYTGDNEKRSSISLGYIGVHNALVALTGNERWHDDPEAVALSHRILERLGELVDAAQPSFHAFVSLYATPSESLCDRFAELDRAYFGTLTGVNDREYYENSFHYASYLPTNPVAKIRFESRYMSATPGGFMYYVEAPNLSVNPRAFEALWDEAYDYVGYFGINSPVDTCFECGFEGEFTCDSEGYCCPGCGNRDENKASVTRRLCGYLGSPMKRPVVHGKQSEINARVKHL
ncbi:anaerobic ribonucleoside-triphosphate reductase [Corynebacterium uterequi]|uniref:Ribonucleoside-triphosphate reductase class III catalytic subunit n=1 Tax=Corynebacterium uterequi TaxID=1072256 RepID=A0A0G3HG50_9CORY|nr:anaerobic ribonucleoside-triphosphate reductase [Corynebacterium uterequi]AKK11715.1 ribonucleoside-triphosphate reductase class III catalytic subunit [Corynebacterium uterequi]